MICSHVTYVTYSINLLKVVLICFEIIMASCDLIINHV